MKKRIITCISLILVLLTLTACTNRNAIDNEPESAVEGKSRTLVAYFSWSGNIQKIARWISEKTGGELFRIVPQEAYPTDYNETTDRAKQELNDRVRPALAAHIDTRIMENYDIIYLGYPVWWDELPMSVVTFLEEYDLGGKTIIPFFSHEGSTLGGRSLDSLAVLNEICTVMTDDALSIRGSRVDKSKDKVIEWLNGLKID